MTANKLTTNYQEYMQLHYLARKKDGKMPKSEILEKIHNVSKKTTMFEKEYARWVTSLYDKEINVEEIKRQIKLLSKYLTLLNVACKNAKDGEIPSVVMEEDIESCKPPKQHRVGKWWNKDKRITQLCALRAAMRGRLHFSPNTKKSTINYYGLASNGIQSQLEWVKDLANEFIKEEN
jgi:hypothetical protein